METPPSPEGAAPGEDPAEGPCGAVSCPSGQGWGLFPVPAAGEPQGSGRPHTGSFGVGVPRIGSFSCGDPGHTLLFIRRLRGAEGRGTAERGRRFRVRWHGPVPLPTRGGKSRVPRGHFRCAPGSAPGPGGNAAATHRNRPELFFLAPR